MIVHDRKKQIAFEDEVLAALEASSRQTRSLRTLVNEGMRDLLRKKAIHRLEGRAQAKRPPRTSQ